MPLVHECRYRVSYGDTDRMDRVYYANYLEICERARTEFLREIGYPYKEFEARGWLFPVRKCEIRYYGYASYDDLLLCRSRISRIKHATLAFATDMAREGEDKVLVAAEVELACVGANGKPALIPDDLRAALMPYVAEKRRKTVADARFLFLVPLLLAVSAAAAAAATLSLDQADEHIAVASRLVEGGMYKQAIEQALAVLEDPDFGQESAAGNQAWLQRREAARFYLERARFGLAATHDEYLDIAEEFAFLFQNRYRLDNPRYAMQSAYWSGRAYQAAEDYEHAISMYSRVGGLDLPQGMEGDAARRVSECLRLLAEEIPYPGTQRDRQRRRRLLDQAIDELNRARQSFPIGKSRKELELDLISLRLAQRDQDAAREALGEVEAFLAGEAARDDLRARATLYRGQAAERLGDIDDAIRWFTTVIEQENPTPEDLRDARIGLALALREAAENKPQEEKKPCWPSRWRRWRQRCRTWMSLTNGTRPEPYWL